MRKKKLSSDGLKASLWMPERVSNGGLIIISHGAGGSMMDHRGTAHLLAQQGWTVCSVLHAGDNFKDKSKLGQPEYWVDRPREISRAIDFILSDPKLGGSIDPDKIGAIGFSAGDYTLLAAAGGKPDLGLLMQHCAAPENDPRFCEFGQNDIGTAQDSDFAAPPLAADRRLKALFLVAPVGAIFGTGSMDDVQADISLVKAGRDQILCAPYHADNIHDLFKLPLEFETFDDLHHFGFIEPFPWYLRLFGFEAAKDPAGYDRRYNLRKINARLSEFFERSLLDVGG